MTDPYLERAHEIQDKYEALRESDPDAICSMIAAEIKKAVEEKLSEYAKLNEGLWKIKVAQTFHECAEIASKAPMQPGAVIYVDEVRQKEPFVTSQEWADHIARLIRQRASEVAK